MDQATTTRTAAEMRIEAAKNKRQVRTTQYGMAASFSAGMLLAADDSLFALLPFAALAVLLFVFFKLTK